MIYNINVNSGISELYKYCSSVFIVYLIYNTLPLFLEYLHSPAKTETRRPKLDNIASNFICCDKDIRKFKIRICCI